ncbi:rhombotarget lipoprotein [uncultured Shewanella sp.]|uniref:rhombotarget lipoprotein n=1 Tax=uncultured Shewanella sp. TaxID=173975 RepID=UPI00261374D9|nr:rhombotarget lipoprotein [uncultured Shewanella sp.]
MKTFLLILSISLLSACSALVMNQSVKKTRSSSLVNFLYPNQEKPLAHKETLPVLSLPVTVGLAFVPAQNEEQNEINTQEQLALLEQVKASFLQYDYIGRIDIIPSAYLQLGKGFSTLDQISRLYDVDIMALVSYDQVTQTTENKIAVLYWTIVGMYLIPGNENAIQTFVDTSVFDIKSRKMLFRAPGTNTLKETSTAIRINDTLSSKSNESFQLAVTDMTRHLNAELARFKTRVKEEKIAKVEHKEGYSGSAINFYTLLILLSIFIFKLKVCSKNIKSKKILRVEQY